MEEFGTNKIFSRSIEKNKAWYVNLLRDGDTKSFATVKDTYDGFPVSKLECVGLVRVRENWKKTPKA